MAGDNAKDIAGEIAGEAAGAIVGAPAVAPADELGAVAALIGVDGTGADGTGADRAGIAALAASLQPFALAPGEQLYRQNDVADGLHLVAEGRISVQGRTLADGVVELAQIGAGDLVGEFALVDHGRRSATAKALEPTRGWFLPRVQFERLVVLGDPAALGLARRLRRLAATRTRATLEALAGEAVAAGELRAAGEGAQGPAGRTPEALSEMLGALHEFRALTSGEAAELVAGAQALTAGRGRLLAAPGDAADGLRIVLRGALRVGLPRDGGIEQLLIHGPGAIAGAAPAVDGAPHAARLDVREDALVLHVGQAATEAWLAGSGGLAGQLRDLVVRQLTADLRALSRHQGRLRSMAALNERS
jgi:CRP-like cAMP-binding protein